MVTVSEQYETYPYPARDPEDEKKRLVTGSPSFPPEIDHFIFGGQRDWSQPIRILVAGGGTGDALIQMATILRDQGKPADITYVDLSTASREIAEARAKIRKLDNITFVTGSLLDAPELGQFDYIDCCGVLHHLPDPSAGFRALRAALAPGGGMGMMVYAPYGRAGVYPLQEAFAQLYEGLSPQARLAKAKPLVKALSKGHPLAANVNIKDHDHSDAGFYDLLLHGQDRPYSVRELIDELEAADWQLMSFTPPGQYDLSHLAAVPESMDLVTQMDLAEKLHGFMKVHVAYVVPKGDTRSLPDPSNLDLVPVLRGIPPVKLAQAVAKGRKIPISLGALKHELELPKQAAPVIAQINGKRTLREAAQAGKVAEFNMLGFWGKTSRALTDWGLLTYSSVLR